MSIPVPVADFGVVIAAGGSGSRFGGTNKLFALLDGRPVFTHSLRAFAPYCRPEALVVVAPESDHAEFRHLAATYCPGLAFQLAAGGATRGRSVQAGLAMLPAGTEYVAVHDAARPLTTPELLMCCLDDARRYGGAIAARPVSDTLKRAAADGTIAATVDRNGLWAVETPQVFALTLLRQAYAAAGEREFTDDGGVMEAAGMTVKLTLAAAPNLKITYPADLATAAALLRAGSI